MSVSLPASDPDVWVAQAIRSGRLGAVRLRETCDHEAIHAAAAAALGYRLSSARVDRMAPYHGEVRFLPQQMGRMHELIVTVAPRALGAGRSTGDAQDAYQLASEIAGNGVACLATGHGRAEVLDRARREALTLAETRTFKVVRKVVREALEKYGALDQADLATIVLAATAASRRKPAAKSQPPRRTVRKATATRGKRCAGCGCAYTPRSPSGKCRGCRGGADV